MKRTSEWSESALPSPADLRRQRECVPERHRAPLPPPVAGSLVEVEGEMDIQVVPLIPVELGNEESFVVFELRGVTFMDAGGLGAIASTSPAGKRETAAASAWLRRPGRRRRS